MIAILGAGKVGSALASICANRSRQVVLYSQEADVVQEINLHHTNTRYLRELRLPTHVTARGEIDSSIGEATLVFIAVPSHAVTEVLSLAAPLLSSECVLVSVTKGLDRETLQPLVLHQATLLPRALRDRIVIIGGPVIAHELIRKDVVGLVAASYDLEHARTVRRALEQSSVRIGTTTDVIGVGVASALKNIYSIAIGMGDGLGMSASGKALLFTMALQELQLLMEAAGGRRETAAQLAGVGDLYAISHAVSHCNRQLGEDITRATDKNAMMAELSREDAVTLASALELSEQKQLTTPLLKTVISCLQTRSTAGRQLHSYLSHLSIHETETLDQTHSKK